MTFENLSAHGFKLELPGLSQVTVDGSGVYPQCFNDTSNEQLSNMYKSCSSCFPDDGAGKCEEGCCLKDLTKHQSLLCDDFGWCVDATCT